MVALIIVFVIMFLGCGFCAVKGILYKRRNIGSVAVAVIIGISELLSAALVSVSGAKTVQNIMLPYYIVHAWLFFALILMIAGVQKMKNSIPILGVSAVVCVYQTYLCVSQYFGARIFSFSKKIFFGTSWWVATDTKNTGLLFSYRSYRIMIYLNFTLAMCALVGCFIKEHGIYKLRVVSLFVMMLLISIVESGTIHYSFPMWLSCILYSAVPFVCLYMCVYYNKVKLREWSLDSFANDMSDGLILFDEYDDLIHINNMIKNTMDEELLESFKDRSKLDAWIAESESKDGDGWTLYNTPSKEYYFRVNTIELGDEKKRVGILYILHDSTNTATRIKVMAEANMELERASRMKSDFLANMSHEIRTPMNAVIGMAELALREEKSPDVKDYLLQIQSSGRNLLNIINDILDYSKIESGKLEIIPEDYEPQKELSDIANVLGTRIGDKKLELFVVSDGDMPGKLHGDIMRIRQVIINLANNAIKFTREGSVRINVTCESAGYDTVNVTVHVVDTGIGIKKEDLGKLFQSFQQVDSKRNRSVEGTGLGLAITKKLVAAMGGTTGVESVYGEGSDFWFSIPQRVVEESPIYSVDDPDEKLVVLFDDDATRREVFTYQIGKLGVGSSVIESLDEYRPSTKKDYIFFDKSAYNDEMKAFIMANPKTSFVMMSGIDAELDTDEDNLHILRRPGTAIKMIKILNDVDEARSNEEEEQTFTFTAPDANILIVDDNPINITIAEGLLSPLGMHVDSAGGGNAAIEKVENNVYDIVFMDHMMPEVDGVDATIAIRAKGKKIKQPVIIALSANVLEEARFQFEEAGMNDFVAKPVDVRVITEKVRKWLPPEKIVESDEIKQQKAETQTRITSDIFDTKTAIRGLGSVELYEKIAEEYYHSGMDKLNDIMTAFEEKDWENYTIRVHALKSSSRQIGAMDLGKMAEELEMAGKAENIDVIMAKTDGVMASFRYVLEELSKVFKAEEKPEEEDLPMIDRETLLGYLDELYTACDDLDSDGMEEVGEKLKGYYYDGTLNGYIKDLQRGIRDIDTDVCMETIDKIKVVLESYY